MMRLSIYALSFIPLANAWTFLYTNATGNATILHNTGVLDCTKISLGAGKLFSWDPEGENLCVSIYHDDKCSNRAGLSCGVDGAWKKDASSNFYGLAIVSNSVASSSTSSATPAPATSTTTSTSSTMTTSTSSTMTSAASTATATTTSAASTSSSSSSSLSGGAIAGIVIGVVAGVLLIAGLFFFVGRRNRRNAAAAAANELPNNSPQGPYTPQSPIAPAAVYPQSSSFGTSEKPPNSSGAGSGRPAPGSRVVELAGHDQSVELGNSPISELDGQTGGKQFYRF